jgi:hypothetical protein
LNKRTPARDFFDNFEKLEIPWDFCGVEYSSELTSAPAEGNFE